MIGLIVLGLALLFFIVVAFFAAKTWHVGHVVAMAFLFLFTLVFLFMTATLMRTHDKFRPDYANSIQGLEQARQRAERLTSGTPSEPAGEGTLVGERTLARVEQAATGRIWGNVRARFQPNGPILLDMRNWSNDGCSKVGQQEDEFGDDEIEPVPDADAAGGADDPALADAGGAGINNPHGIAANQLVYAFKEMPIARLSPAEKEYYFGELGEGEDSFPSQDTKGACRVPVAYLGRYLVQEATDQTLTVVPAGPLTAGQQQQLANNAPWVLYEELPADSYDVFAGVEAAALPNLIPLQRLTQTGLPITQAAYQRLLGEYARHGKEVTQQVANPFRLNVRVKFLQDYEEVVDLVVEVELPTGERPFDVQGRAQVPNLMQGEPTKFAKGDEAVFDGETANRLIQQGIAERVGAPTYSRQLRDFEFALTDQHLRLEELGKETQTVQKQVDDLAASLQRLQEQIDKHREELTRLQQDQQGFDAERQQLAQFRSILTDRLNGLQSEVSRLLAARSE